VKVKSDIMTAALRIYSDSSVDTDNEQEAADDAADNRASKPPNKQKKQDDGVDFWASCIPSERLFSSHMVTFAPKSVFAFWLRMWNSWFSWKLN